MDDKINRLVHEAMGLTKCTCPTGCDCEDFERGLVSNECPVHNDYPDPACECPLHSSDPDYDMADYANSLDAAFTFADKLIANGWEATVTIEKSGVGSVFELFCPVGPAVRRSAEVYPVGSLGSATARAICLSGLAALGVEVK